MKLQIVLEYGVLLRVLDLQVLLKIMLLIIYLSSKRK
jgi:hypothetical protein